MKRIYLFCTKIKVFLIELPVLVLLAFAYHYNEMSDNIVKLYPLMIFLVLVMIFILVYFFRAISISYEEIRYHGLFSGRDRAIINKDKQLIITVCARHKIRVELFGNDGTPPELDWVKKGEEFTPVDIYLFRGKALGGVKTVKKILSYFEVDSAEFESIFSRENYSCDSEFVSLTSEKKNGERVVTLKMKETV